MLMNHAVHLPGELGIARTRGAINGCNSPADEHWRNATKMGRQCAKR